MKGNYKIQISGITEALNIFGKSTGEYYLFYEFATDWIRFSENIGMADDLFSVKKTGCTLDEWRKGVDSRDVHRLEKVMENLITRKTCSYNLNYRVKNSKGQNHWINSRGRAYYAEDGSPLYVLGQLSGGDRLGQTGACGNEELKKEIKKFMEDGKDGCLLIFGVDNLKAINLRSGRGFGDAVLNDVSRVIKDELCRSRIFRINGDCFAANMEMLPREEAEILFQKVQKRLAGQCAVSGGYVPYGIYPAADEGMFLQYGEMALDYSKTHGKNRLTFFSEGMYEEKRKALELKEDLIRSIESGFKGFEVYYQAQVRSETYEIYGAEALLRYRSPRRGTVSPLEFIPVLEQSGLICKVGLWVLEEALRACREWRKKIPDFHISVNISDVQLQQDSVEEDILDRVRQSGVPGSALTLEITESMQLTNYLYLNSLFLGWQQKGIEIAVDDFGTGYSSLSCLKEMAIDELKIDRCFVREIQNSAYNYRLLSNIIELASMCPFRVCCEGVETPEELAVLEDLHPTLFQGYLFAEPCSREDFETFYIEACSQVQERCRAERQAVMRADGGKESGETDEEIVQTILNAENDIFYLADMDTYELYYLNAAGQKLFGVKNYRGRTCHKVLHGKDTPCAFCTNPFLRQDSFYIWENKNEYCGRHFLLKDKLVPYRGKMVRLEVALDITKQEYISQSARERLIFAEKIVGYMNTLASHSDYTEAVELVLESIGDFYQADRAYLFECDNEKKDCWSNTFEWCAPGVVPQKEKLQNISFEMLKRWMEEFRQGKSVIILNLDTIKSSNPLEWEVLNDQKIQRLIAVPMGEEGNVIGFVGVDNPRCCIRDDTQARVLATFLLTRIRQDKNEKKYQELLEETEAWRASGNQKGRENAAE